MNLLVPPFDMQSVFLTSFSKCLLGTKHHLNGILMVSVNLSDIYIFSIQGVEYHCPIDGISKIEAINLLQDTDLCEKS